VSAADLESLDVWADPAKERLATPATILTGIRTAGSVVVSGFAIEHRSLTLLIIALAIHWIGDILDGRVARWMHHETRIGAVVDIMCDRFCAVTFYLGLAWLYPDLTVPVLLYLCEFMVLDNFLSLAFLAWRVRSPNYFFVVDRVVYELNWTPLAKTANSGLFAVLLIITRQPWLGVVIALAVIAVKIVSLVRLFRIGLPIPGALDPGARPGAGPGTAAP
jgi:CDP-diacylglycerol--glycerol-3-phosphate 3-phosphatidyltransferase